jgi:hypothetical protein
MSMFNDIKGMIMNSNVIFGKSNDKLIQYNSELFGKLELGGEMYFQTKMTETKTLDSVFGEKKTFILILELIRAGFKLKELKELSDIGFDFYFGKKIYFENLLKISEDEFFHKIEGIKYILNLF